MIEEQKNNPLHGVKLEALLTELVDHYGWDVLASAININCFKSNPSIKSSLKFLRKTPWAREKVEGFYLYKYKRLPKPDDEQYELPPRDRKVPLNQKPRDPAVIEVDKSERPKRSVSDKKSSVSDKKYDAPKRNTSSQEAPNQSVDPWAKWKSKNQD
ncbi:VF530 family DNA-binding protein [Pseudomaricurvus sp.]|uniref:VF530 family protein n=1 Tax=Pseudomaricurvus sp. TaxID=2004510 RepID=UPI003F6B7EED